jgi:hypothetical protein
MNAVNDKDLQSQFFTRDRANAGVRIPLYTPSGRKTDQWIQIRGVDSDEFRAADTKAKRDAVRLASIKDEKERDEAVYELTTRLTASLVIAWSFPEECTEENIIAFFKQAPQICSSIDITASDRGYFFRNASVSSDATPDMSSTSARSRKAQSKV